MMNELSRRGWLAGVAGGMAGAASELPAQRAETPASFTFCLNTSTVRDAAGKSRPILDLVALATKAGYHAIEPWISELNVYAQSGGSLKELGKRITDAGLTVPDAIGFAEWIVDDPVRRKKGLEQAKRDMDMVQQIGGRHIAAPPVGATGGTSKRDDPNFTRPICDLLTAADRYRDLLAVGKAIGVKPIVEIWGFSKSISRLGEAICLATECGSTEGCILPDIYHLYKGGSDFAGLSLLGSTAIGIFHVNDYPRIDRARITDADRVYPGDGIAPLKEVFADLRKMGYRGHVSLELFNRSYWKQDPMIVAKTGLEKLRAVAAA